MIFCYKELYGNVLLNKKIVCASDVHLREEEYVQIPESMQAAALLEKLKQGR